MNQDTDRIAVPTNGRGPHPATPPVETADVTETADLAEATAPVRPDEPASLDADGEDDGSTLAFTPTQIAVGLGVVASLILLVVGRRRRGDG